jgi:hypothetical protein
MNNKVFIARNYRSKFDAAGKAKMDCETVLLNNGWRNVGFKQTWISNSLLGTLISAIGITWGILRIPKNSYICLQYPFNKFYGYCLWGAKRKNCKVITIVHDVKSLKGKYGYSQDEIDTLNESDQLIVHNKAMRTWFESQNIKPDMYEIGAFDYLHEPKLSLPKAAIDYANLRIVFAGNMGSKQSFIYSLDDTETAGFTMDLYGVGFYPESVKKSEGSVLNYKGMFPADEVIDRIDGDFGLVWYGESLDSCDGVAGQYLKYNNPHKLSLYLLCEMPIVIWDKAAMAAFVTEHDIGITVSSLTELSSKITSLSKEDVERFKTNVKALKLKLEKGELLSAALRSAEAEL